MLTLLLLRGVGMGGGTAPANPAIAQYVAVHARIEGATYIYHTPLHNLQSAVAPTVDDDASIGYAPGSIWIDKTLEDAYICIRAVVGAAVWKLIT